MDLGIALGLLSAFQACRRLIKGSLLWLGCPCSSWVWVSRGSTRRCRLRPAGDTKVRSVKQASRLVRRLCYLLLAATGTCSNKPGRPIGTGILSFWFQNLCFVLRSGVAHESAFLLEFTLGWSTSRRSPYIGVWNSQRRHYCPSMGLWRLGFKFWDT